MGKIMNTNKKLSFRKLYAFGKKLPIDLSLSENPLGCSPRVTMVLRSLNRNDFFDYPDPDSSSLRKAISNRLNIDADSIFVANGSEMIIKMLPEAVLNKGDEVIIPQITFPMFRIATEINGNKVVTSAMTKSFDIDLSDIRNKITPKTKLIFLCNPNNPTGRILKRKDILDFAQSVKALVVVDEANIEFGGESVVADTNSLRNLIVLRTFSKGFGLAGLRIGFCVANSFIINQLKKVAQPFPVSAISQKAAIIALNDVSFIRKTKGFMKKERDFLTKELSEKGFKVITSGANNLLVSVNSLFDSSTAFVALLNKNGVSVVNGDCFGGLGDKFIRVSPRLRRVNRQFLEVIDKILDTKDN